MMAPLSVNPSVARFQSTQPSETICAATHLVHLQVCVANCTNHNGSVIFSPSIENSEMARSIYRASFSATRLGPRHYPNRVRLGVFIKWKSILSASDEGLWRCFSGSPCLQAKTFTEWCTSSRIYHYWSVERLRALWRRRMRADITYVPCLNTSCRIEMCLFINLIFLLARSSYLAPSIPLTSSINLAQRNRTWPLVQICGDGNVNAYFKTAMLSTSHSLTMKLSWSRWPLSPLSPNMLRAYMHRTWCDLSATAECNAVLLHFFVMTLQRVTVASLSLYDSA